MLLHRTLTSPLRHHHARRSILAAGALAALIFIAGCAAQTPSTGDDHTASTIEHAHNVVADPSGSGFLIGTHDGIYTATDDGKLGPRVDGPRFDAMGLTAVGDILLASGHPGRTTPPGLGDPHLGIIRSTDTGRSWTPVAFTGEKDFHVLATAPDGTVYGVPTDSSDVLVSTDEGDTWTPTGGSIPAFNLVADATGRVIASTPDGLQVSTDGAASFGPWADTPLIALLGVSPDHQRIVGVASGGKIWTTTAGAPSWSEAGTVHGQAQAIAITNTGDLLVVDDSGLTLLPSPPSP
ncbi:F510_1955 family glycosylhydrolase [Microbacterium sp. NPDC056044]|uniref:F510_1955 family glycosylhydrolase n=1 Tax=unclassified Microbacterium TaxID=2609290 RepID=UPI0035DC97CC